MRHDRKPPFAVFIATTVVIFFLALSAADSVGFVPNYLDAADRDAQVATTDVQTDASTLALASLPELGQETQVPQPQPNVPPKLVTPKRIQISAIDLDLQIQNPSTRDIDKLDAILVNGPARYVDSAGLGVAGNMIIFAHSSHLPVVHNKMFKAFNRVPELKSGDIITLQDADGLSYIYSVTDLKQADAGDTTIDLSDKKGTRLTLVTCDTLTGKSARFVLTAEFVGTAGN